MVFMVEEIKELLSGIPGVISVNLLREEDVETVHSAEAEYEKLHVVRVSNLGLHVVLQRDLVFILLKDSSFRKPPVSTLYMVEEMSPEEAKVYDFPEHLIQVNDQYFKVVGEEIMYKDKPYQEKTTYFNDDFVLFPNRRKGRQGVPAYFLIPPIPFPELEEIKDTYSINSIMSVSPCTITDTKLRELYQLPPDTEYATILVGFDSAGHKKQ